MDEINLFNGEPVDPEAFPVPAEETPTVKEEDENWKRYVESAWWWGWYN